MTTILRTIRKLVPGVVALSCVAISSSAQEITIPDPELNATIRATLQKPNGPLTQEDLLGLTNLTAISRNISSLQGLGAAHNLTTLVLDDNHIADFPNELGILTRLAVVDLSENPLTSLTFANGQTNLIRLRVENGGLTNLTLPAGLKRLAELRVGFNRLSSLIVPPDMTNLSVLSVYQNQLTNVILPPSLANLSELNLDGNQLSSLQLPAGLTKLAVLIAGANQLGSFTVPADMTNLNFLRLNDNQITNLALPAGLSNLSFLYLPRNQLSSLALPAGMTNLATLVLNENQLTDLTLPPDVTQLFAFFFGGNRLKTFVLSEPLGSTRLASVVESLRNQGIAVFTYPLTIQLRQPQAAAGQLTMEITGPPGIYSIFSSVDLTAWNVLGVSTNSTGSINFTDLTAESPTQKFYRALLHGPPANMVFIPPNPLTIGSPRD